MSSMTRCMLAMMNGKSRSESSFRGPVLIACPRMKLSGEQFDDRIVEVHWDADVAHWRMMRFRDDKPRGNHRSVVENIIQSIADGVEKDAVSFRRPSHRIAVTYSHNTPHQLLARSNAIRNAWKARHGQPQQASAAPSQPPPMRPPPPALKPQRAIAAEYRYGPLASSPWSKVGGPALVAGMKR